MFSVMMRSDGLGCMLTLMEVGCLRVGIEYVDGITKEFPIFQDNIEI